MWGDLQIFGIYSNCCVFGFSTSRLSPFYSTKAKMFHFSPLQSIHLCTQPPVNLPGSCFVLFFYPSAPCDFHLSQMMASEWWTRIYLVSELSYFSSLHINITITTIIITSFTMRGALLSSKQLQKLHYLDRSGDIDGSIPVLLARKRAGSWKTHLSFCLFQFR